MVMMMLYLLLALPVATTAKEIIATYEWQKIGPTDTLPAGLEIRMDLSGGGKWARLPPNEPKDIPDQEVAPHKKRCGPSCKERQAERAEKRRGAGFLLREQKHNRRREHELAPNDDDVDANSSILHPGSILLVGLVVGIGVATQLRRRTGGLHEH